MPDPHPIGRPKPEEPQPCAIVEPLDEFTAKVAAMDLAAARETLLAKHAFEARLIEENKQPRDGLKETAHVSGYTANLLPLRDGLVNYMQTVALEGVEVFEIHAIMKQEGK